MKEKLVVYHSDNIHAYVNIKDPVCDIILTAAGEWAEKVNWKVPVD